MGSFFKNDKLYTGRVEAELTGRNAEEVIFHDSVAITDTSFYPVEKDISKYKKIKILVVNTLDQPVDIQVKSGGNVFLKYYDSASSTWKTDGNSLPDIPSDTSGYEYILNYALNDETLLDGLKALRLVARCSTTPTSGALTTKVIGVIN